jgi:hypothetical protein
MRTIQQHFVEMMHRGGLGAGDNTGGGSNSSRGWSGRRLAEEGSSSSSSSSRGRSQRRLAEEGSSSSSSSSSSSTAEIQEIYQQQQCAEGYTGPLCATCVHDPDYVPSHTASHPLLQNLSSSASASTPHGRRYGKFHQACKACPSNRALSVLYYLLARLLDLLLIAVQVVLVVRERHKRIVKLNSQMAAKMSGKAAPPPPKKTPKGVAAKVVAAKAKVTAQLKRVWPDWLRSSLALAPLMRKEHNKVPKSEELASEFVVQVSLFIN